jgi:hypothetical protein
MTRAAREVVELYNLVVWNERNSDLAEELMGDTVIRHEVGEAQTLTHEQAVQRIVDNWAMFDKLRFDLNLVVAGEDGEQVAIVYQSPMELRTARRQAWEVWRSSVSLTGGSSRFGTVATSRGFGHDACTR